MTTDKIIDKIKKLHNQAEGEAAVGNSAAAEAFAAAVNRLLLQHDLSMAEVSAATLNVEEPIIKHRVDLEAGGVERVRSRVAWQELLASVVANAHMCKLLVVTGSNSIIFVGTKAHVDVAEYIYCILVRTASKLSIEERYRYSQQMQKLGYKGKDNPANGSFRESWLLAFTQRISERFKEARRAAAAETGNTGTALIRLDNALIRVEDFMKEQKGVKKAAGLRMDMSHSEGRARGRAAADRVGLGTKGVQGSSRVPGLLK